MLNTLKINTIDLDIGMFVSGLDRPWLETPFLTQGFLIESPEDIDRLRQYCEYVLVDSRRSRQQGALGRRKQRTVHHRSVDQRKLDGRPRVPVEKIFKGRSIKPYKDESA